MWTQADIDRLKDAIVNLASGKGVQQVRYDGPPARSVTYQPAELGQMRALLASMQQDVARQAGRGRTVRYAKTSKGF